MRNYDETALLERIADLLNDKAGIPLHVSCNRLTDESVSIRTAGGEDKERFLDGGRVRTLPLAFVAKSQSARTALSSLYGLLETLEEGAEGILSVNVASYPQLVDKGEDRAVYEAQAEVAVYKTAE